MSIIHIKNLLKDYRDQEGHVVRVLNISAFELSSAQQLGVEGLSGSGKSTLLNIIAGILTPTAGSVMVVGRDMAALKEAERDQWRAQHIGYVFQTFNLLQGYSALENIMLAQAFGRGTDESFARDLLNRVGLLKLAHRKPRELSIGQQQRIAVARALANKPHVVLADEPTGNLDAQHAAQVIDLMSEICRENQAALMLVSHDRHVLNRFKHTIPLTAINHV